MATLETQDFHLDEKLRGDIRRDSAFGSYIAKVRNQEPVDLTTESVLSSTGYSGAQAVAEGAPKAETPYGTKVHKVERGQVVSQVRVSTRALRKAEANKVKVLENAQKTLAEGFGKSLDIILTHNTSPLDGSATVDFTRGLATGADTLVHNIAAAEAPDEALRAVIAQQWTSEKNVDAIALTPAFYAKLAYQKDGQGRLLYPQFTAFPESEWVFDGIKVVRTSAIANKRYKPATEFATDIDFIVLDSNAISYGFELETLELITTGDPDNTGRDLKGHNEVMLRLESIVEAVITDKDAIVVGKRAAE